MSLRSVPRPTRDSDPQQPDANDDEVKDCLPPSRPARWHRRRRGFRRPPPHSGRAGGSNASLSWRVGNPVRRVTSFGHKHGLCKYWTSSFSNCTKRNCEYLHLKVCFEYVKSGRCKKNSCPFLHEVPSRPCAQCGKVYSRKHFCKECHTLRLQSASKCKTPNCTNITSWEICLTCHRAGSDCQHPGCNNQTPYRWCASHKTLYM